MDKQLESYITAHSDAEPDYLQHINRATHLRLINPRMLSGHLQGRFLSMLCRIFQPKRILELGCYSGYSALCMAEALPEDGELHSIEIDDELEDFIRENLASVSFGEKVKLHIGDALEVIKELEAPFDLVFIDADKRQYTEYYELILPKLRPGGIILADNTLWDGKVVMPAAANDQQTKSLQNFNEFVGKDERVEKIILPLRDGLTIIRKK